MKRFLFVFFIIFSEILFSIENTKVLVLPFKNNGDKRSNFYSNLILDTIKINIVKLPKKIEKNEFEKNVLGMFKKIEDNQLFLSVYELDLFEKNYIVKDNYDMENYEKVRNLFFEIGYANLFFPIQLKDLSLNENITDYNEIYKTIINKSIDLIITGFYYEDTEKIVITFKVIDVLTDRTKITYVNYGDSGHDVFDVIIESTNKFIDKMNKEIIPYAKKMNLFLKDKQSRLIAGEQKEIFMFFNFGMLYSSMSFSKIVRVDKADFDLANKRNKYINGFSSIFNFEFYSSYKNNYHGFGINFNIPFIYQLPNLQIIARFTAGYIFGFRKKFFFSFLGGVYFKTFSIFESFSYNRIEVSYFSLLLGFKFKFIPLKYPFFIQAGAYFVLPKFNINGIEQIDGPSLWNISTKSNYDDSSGYVNKNNWILPVMANFGAGCFFNKEIGIYFNTTFYTMYIIYNVFESKNEHDDEKLVYYGENFSLNFDIEIGVVFKTIFR
ncbi:MAG: hypothetical protein JXB50_14585 [Spirochaetes bacterium]|nr:hypothetical protein [Spirochaetota bacterium]